MHIKKRLFLLGFFLLLVGSLPSNAYSFGVSQREGAGGYQPDKAEFVLLPVQFFNFYYDKTQVQASVIQYRLKYDQLDSAIAAAFGSQSLREYPLLKFIEDAKMKEPSNGRAMGQLYQDFAQVLKDSVSVTWPLLDKSKKFYLGRQFGNTLQRLPADLTDKYFVVPMGQEFENEKSEVFGFLGVAIVDKDAEIITAAAVRYDPTNYSQAKLENDFGKLIKACAKKLRKEKKPRPHEPRIPELKSK